MIVRGAYFCPSAVHCIAAYLQIPTNNMILGVPDTDFAFPLSKLKGVRIAVPRSDKAIRDNTCAHLRDIINAATVPLPDITEMKAPNSPTKLRTISQILSLHRNKRKSESDRKLSIEEESKEEHTEHAGPAGHVEHAATADDNAV
jgi:hypothetical protein